MTSSFLTHRSSRRYRQKSGGRDATKRNTKKYKADPHGLLMVITGYQWLINIKMIMATRAAHDFLHLSNTKLTMTPGTTHNGRSAKQGALRAG